MAVDFRCENCGKLLSLEADPGSAGKCPHCGKRVAVPAALASLPRPQIPPNVPPAMAGAPPAAHEQPEEELPLESGDVMNVMARIMPWVISVFFHVGLGLILAFVTMFVIVDRVPKEVTIPDAVLSDDPGGRMNPGERNPNLQAAQPTPTDQRHTTLRELSLVPDTGKTDERIDLIGTSGGGMAGGAMAQLGLTGGGSGAGPRSSFFGHGGNAHHIVYVIDRSGSMIDTFDYVRHEMVVSISKLKPIQDFHIILFAAGPAIEHGPKRLVPGTKEYKDSAAEFLRPVRPEGQTNPVPALMRAFEVLERAGERPGKLIYLLTDAAFPDNAKVLSEVQARNAKKDVHINTFLYGKQPPQAVDVMKKIAAENGGTYKYVSPDE